MKHLYGAQRSHLSAFDSGNAWQPARTRATFPEQVSLLSQFPPALSQAHQDCVENALCQLARFFRKQQGIEDVPLSRNMAYYLAKVQSVQPIPDKTLRDNGSSMRDAVFCLERMGFAAETVWPYNSATFFKEPSAAAYLDGFKRRLGFGEYFWLTIGREADGLHYRLDDLRGCLSEGKPFAFSMSVLDGMPLTNGVLRVPTQAKIVSGQTFGHAAVCTGYDDATETFECLNSWGPNWGDKGAFWMSYGYMLDPLLTFDHLTLGRFWIP